MIAFFYLARRYLIAASGALIAVCTVYLIVDFADRAKFYQGPGWVRDVLVLYGLKAIVEINQLMPAALATGATVAISGLRRDGEVIALWSLGRGPMTFVLPIAFVSSVIGVGLYFAQDPIIAPASEKADEMSATRFNHWGDWGNYHRAQKWFKGDQNRIFYLGKGDGVGFSDVMMFELSDDFRLQRRTDAARIDPVGNGDWRLSDVERRDFDPVTGALSDRKLPWMTMHLTENLNEFRIAGGKPSQVAMKDLPVEIELRKKLGLPFREWELALHERRTYQAIGIPGALIGMALALRSRRRGHLTAATAEGFGVTFALWVATGLSHTAAISGHMSPFLGGFLPLILASLGAVAAVRWLR